MIDLDPSALLTAQHRLGGRYRLDALVVEGAAGALFRGRDEDVDVEVAIKLVSPALTAGEAELTRFVEVASRLRGIHDAALVRTYEVGVDGGRAFYTMPFMDGLTLREVMDVRAQKGLTFTVAEVLPLFGQLANALDALAHFGPHGSLRPTSVLVLSELLKVTGAAHLAGLPRDRFVASVRGQGAAGYLAPEARSGSGPIGLAADVYSLTAIMCEMLAGVVGSREPEAWRVAGERLPGRLAAVLHRGLATAPSDRYPDVRSLLAAVSETVGDAPAAPLAVPRPEKTPAPRTTTPRRQTLSPQPAAAASPPTEIATAAVDPEPSRKKSPVLLVGAAIAVLAAGGGVYALRAPHSPATAEAPAADRPAAAAPEAKAAPESPASETLEMEVGPGDAAAPARDGEPGGAATETQRADPAPRIPGQRRYVLRPAKRAKTKTAKAEAPIPVHVANPEPIKRDIIPAHEQQVKAELPPEPPPPPPPPAAFVKPAEEPVISPVLISGPPIDYSAEAYNRHVQGHVTATCMVTSQGTVKDCKILKSLAFMDGAVLRALHGRRYKPATQGGKPIDLEVTFNVVVKMPEE
jgi:TonB family protein